MGNSAIEVENLGKCYQIGELEDYYTLRDSLTNILKFPYKLISSDKKKSETEFIWALKDLNFEVKQGEILGVIGRNGAGKSTLLKILSRITTPTKGRIKINGRVGSLLEVGTGFHPELTGRENIYLNGSILGMSKKEIERKFDEIVDFAEVEKFLDTPVKRYSSGMYVRLAFAVAAHMEPEILIIDEVLAVGDIAFQKKCLGKMDDVSKEGRTILFVSHNLNSISSLSTEILILNKGVGKFYKNKDEAIENYAKDVNNHKKLSYIEFENKMLKWASIEQIFDKLLLKVEFISDIKIDKPSLGFVFYDELGNPIFGSNTRLNNCSEKNNLKSGLFETVISNPKLNDGSYKISLWFGNSVKDLIYIKDCLNIEVHNMNTQKQLPKRYVGCVVPEYDCKILNYK